MNSAPYILAATTSSSQQGTQPVLPGVLILIVVWTLFRKPSPGSTNARDCWAGLTAWILGPVGYCLKKQWRRFFVWLVIYALILVPLFTIFLAAPQGNQLVWISFVAFLLALVALQIITVIRVVKASYGAPAQAPLISADLIVAKALEKKKQTNASAAPPLQPPPEPKASGRIRRALCAIRGFVDRHLTTKTVIVVTILLLLASWIYPPWIVGSYRNVSHGWFFIFDTTRQTAMRVDFGRLFLIDAVIAATGGLVAWAVSHESTVRRVAVRLAFYTLFVAPLAIVVISLGPPIARQVAEFTTGMERAIRGSIRSTNLERLMLVRDGNGAPEAQRILAAIKQAREAGYTDQEIYNFLARKFGGFVEIRGLKGRGYRIAENDGKTLAGLEQALSNDALVVQPDDLQKITLFDVDLISPSGVALPYCSGFYGEARNDLPRAVEKVRLKASFYDATDSSLIRVWTGEIFPKVLQPGKPMRFTAQFFEASLTSTWKYRLEVIEAHYVDSEPWKKDPIVR